MISEEIAAPEWPNAKSANSALPTDTMLVCTEELDTLDAILPQNRDIGNPPIGYAQSLRLYAGGL